MQIWLSVCNAHYSTISLADLMGCQGHPLRGPNSFIFMQFGKKLQNNRFLGVGVPTSGKSWIRQVLNTNPSYSCPQLSSQKLNIRERKKYTYPEIVPLRALIACNAINCPRDAAISFTQTFLLTEAVHFGQYISNVQWSTRSVGFLTIFISEIRNIS